MTTEATDPKERTKITTLTQRVATVRDFFEANKLQIAVALPRHLTLDRMIRTAFTAFNTTPGLWECDRRSLFGAVVQCAQLGLEPGLLGMVYLIPFRNTRRGMTEVQVIVGYKGLLALARRSGEISTISAVTVHARDTFARRLGTDPEIKHVPSEDADPGAFSHFYAVARLKDGGVQMDCMTKAEIDAHRDRYSRAAKQGPWLTNYEEMAKKTVLRRLSKLLPASIELHTAVALDEQAEVQIPQNLGDFAPPDPPESNGGDRTKLDALTERLDAAAPPA